MAVKDLSLRYFSLRKLKVTKDYICDLEAGFDLVYI